MCISGLTSYCLCSTIFAIKKAKIAKNVYNKKAFITDTSAIAFAL